VRVLITGGAGFIGSHLADELSGKGADVIIYDNLTSGKTDNIKNIRHTFIENDIRDCEQLNRCMERVDFVIHLAALTSVIESIERPEDYFSVNVNGTLNVLKTARAHNVKKVLFASSAAVYGDSPLLPKYEDMRPEPQSPYAITKLDGEYFCNLYHCVYNVPTVAARFFNVFGERQDERSAYAAAVPIFISCALRNELIQIYGDGRQTRDFIYIKDIVNALIFLMEKGEGIFNIGYGSSITVNDLVQEIQRLVGSQSKVTYVPERPGEIKHSSASAEKIRQLGFAPEFSLEQGLKRTVEFMRGHG
jgi:UDP-glucose 4-epimerase